MIHFSDIINHANIIISNEKENTIINEFSIKNKDFINLKLSLNSGNYQIKIIQKEEELLKSIIVK